MTRLTQSDIIRSLEQQAEEDRREREALLAVVKEVLAALTEKGNPRTASETVEIARSGTGSNPTVIKIGAVAQEDESLDAALARAGAAFEQAASRYPLPNGLTHPHPLGEGIEAAPTLAEQLEASAKDELASKRAKGKDGAK